MIGKTIPRSGSPAIHRRADGSAACPPELHRQRQTADLTPISGNQISRPPITSRCALRIGLNGTRLGQAAGMLRPAVCLLMLSAPSCELVEPTDRTYNDKAVPPVTRLLTTDALKPDQHVAGTLVFTFTPDTLADDAEALYLFVDSAMVAGVYGGPTYTFQIDTRQWEEGPHLIMIGLKEAKPNIGLLGLAGMPSVFYATRLVFDQTPPTAVRLVSLAWDDGSPLLRWTQNNDLNFSSYRIWRGGNCYQNTQWFDYGMMHEVDSVVVQTATGYRDLNVRPLIGLDLKYRVSVSNGVELSMSDTLGITFGNRVAAPIGDPIVPRPLRDPAREVLYVLGGDTLASFDSPTHTVTHSTRLAAISSCLAINQDGSLLFVLGWVPSLTVVNPANLSVVSTMSLNTQWNGQSLWAEGGLSNRVYVSTRTEVRPLKVIDGVTGSILEEPAFTGNGWQPVDGGPLAMSPDRSTLYLQVSPYSTMGRDTVYRLDVSAPTATLTEKRAVSQPVGRMQVSADGRGLYLLIGNAQAVDVWDATTLEDRRIIPLPGRAYDLVTGPASVYISHSVPTEGVHASSETEIGRVAQFSYTSPAALASWDLVGGPAPIEVSRGEHTVLVLTNLYYYGKKWWEIRK